MATTLQPPSVKFPSLRGVRRTQEVEPEVPSTGIWVGLAAITMTFAAFTSAMIVRHGSAPDWRHFSFPVILYFNTIVLIASSFTLQIARKRFAALSNGISDSGPALRALYGTLTLGCLFVCGQYAAWLQLRSEGIYLATNPSSSFFYLFTVLHALHVIGGLLGLIYVINKLHRNVLAKNTLGAASLYWHFMGVLWLYLLGLLWVRI
ncbi:MAG TPA: cytochrome c oxidase subunit 3 [Terriglobales bacterium]|nr:cytochrome c oxidase subunit 3 [Terriglobales bacterium]